MLRPALRLSLAVMALTLLLTSPAAAAPKCVDLLAGQTLVAGQVCVDNDEDYLYVQYSAAAGWSIDEVHLFVGNSLTGMPKTRSGNPQVGLFPYADLVGGDFFEYKLPLGDFEASCGGSNLALAAHAVVQRTDSGKRESAWGAGTRLVAKGNWATWFEYTTTCPPPPPTQPTACLATETAFAVGDQTFHDLGIRGGSWGWQITVAAGTANGTAPLYAGAAQNDTSKGTYVGDVVYQLSNGDLTVTYVMAQSFGLKATHVYAANTPVTTRAPGQFGNTHDPLDDVSIDAHTISGLSEGTVYLVAHADVCTVTPVP